MKKNRFSIPARIIELLYADDAFFNDVIKLKKVGLLNKFPKSDEWRGEDGFHISFALAGYAPSDALIEVEGNVLTVTGIGMDSIESTTEVLQTEQDSFYEKKAELKPRIHVGTISRGIARRKFCVKHVISEEFDVEKAEAMMEHGLLHVFIPNRPMLIRKLVTIKNGRE